MNGQENNIQYTFQLHRKHLLFIVLVIIGVSILLILLLRTVLNSSDSLKSLVIVNTPTLTAPTIFDQGTTATKEILVADAQKDLTSLLPIYISYLKYRESENLYLLLDPESQNKFSRDDLKNILEKSGLMEIKIGEGITWQVYSSGSNSVKNLTPEDEKATIPESGYLKATVPINFVYSSKRERSTLLSAKFQNEKWLFDFPVIN